MPKLWKVTRVWYVKANNAIEAMEKARDFLDIDHQRAEISSEEERNTITCDWFKPGTKYGIYKNKDK